MVAAANGHMRMRTMARGMVMGMERERGRKGGGERGRGEFASRRCTEGKLLLLLPCWAKKGSWVC